MKIYKITAASEYLGVSKNDLLLEKLAISIVKSYCSDDDIDESCCVFCNTDLSRNNEYKHNDNCVVPQAMRWLMENKMCFT